MQIAKSPCSLASSLSCGWNRNMGRGGQRGGGGGNGEDENIVPTSRSWLFFCFLLHQFHNSISRNEPQMEAPTRSIRSDSIKLDIRKSISKPKLNQINDRFHSMLIESLRIQLKLLIKFDYSYSTVNYRSILISGWFIWIFSYSSSSGWLSSSSPSLLASSVIYVSGCEG